MQGAKEQVPSMVYSSVMFSKRMANEVGLDG